ncbi:hypothetical protein HDV00_003639 [Rhizophlyctis rosea]|nr:hypothetical protein HDV00_003639 [Rhizophlyctis rosea]
MATTNDQINCDTLTFSLESTIFAVPKSQFLTVLKTHYPNSYFTALLSGRWNPSDPTASTTPAISIDRPAKPFQYILDFILEQSTSPPTKLQSLNIQDMPSAEIDALLEETDYYNLPSLRDTIYLHFTRTYLITRKTVSPTPPHQIIRWTKKTKEAALVYLALCLDPCKKYTEWEITEYLKGMDRSSPGAAIVTRRTLVESGLVKRQGDGSAYWREEGVTRDGGDGGEWWPELRKMRAF